MASYIHTRYELLLFLLHLSFCSASFSYDFYGASCPSAELIVSSAVRTAALNDPTIPGKLLRLLFHDCFVEGCDGSVLLQGNKTERSDPANESLGGFEVIDSAKRTLELECPGIVSCADIVALAARDAVSVTGGPSVRIPTGRRDGRRSSKSNVRENIIDTSFGINDMAKIFASKGLSLDDIVTLSGAHTIGLAHCGAFSDRFEEDSHGNLRLTDADMDRGFADELMKVCPADASSSTTVHNDAETPFAFDNQYYRNLIAHRGLFQSDSALLNDANTRKQVEDYAANEDEFFADWNLSFFKLTSIGVKVDDEGDVRRDCSSLN